MEARDGAENKDDFRVPLTSKKQAIELMNQYKAIINQALDGQSGIPEKTKRLLLKKALADFEAAVTANVLVRGQTWDQAPDDDDPSDEEEGELVSLETRMDDAVVELSHKRRAAPPQILKSAVRALRAQRELQDFSKTSVKSNPVVTDLQIENAMKDLAERASGLANQRAQLMESLDTLRNQARGLRLAADFKPGLPEVDWEEAPPSPRPRREVRGDACCAAYVGKTEWE
ncbi:uncharacterized protein LOC130908001 [Corythoichthys intestinalis]|uniref:uncharacterized protein LOC130908001 n=1 Tax=Corythoichthys intestinalis TaxID=161448 RepID=UPI0025A4E424|nr:uncharacterized protein LOC130908001 [Corythoichthys intestinalis]